MSIAGLEIIPLRIIADDRGSVMHMLRADAMHFASFGEIYFSTVHRGVVKGWKRHRQMQLSLAVPVGAIRFVCFDGRPDSVTAGRSVDLTIGPANYKLLIIPPGVWTAFQGVAEGTSLLANCASIPHDPAEADNRSLDDSPMNVDWTLA
ncbi:MAG: dTDP-4-dehydrorhamnose 3,5-epimerase [Rhodopseudomonas sp.]|nr:dTDP-4-dehydrorhamnose 3,5-epimerase [Rhodopseudomonas sp.]